VKKVELRHVPASEIERLTVPETPRPKGKRATALAMARDALAEAEKLRRMKIDFP
jgi:hypothetical protein